MNIQRAQEIFQSTKSITVFHNGESIWIEKLDPSTNTAYVRAMSGEKNVLVSELQEVH
ncbi:H-type small acid-soluble spore protein [Marinisporobacter balticus]|uniref:Small acid-soluble spore protein H (Minor) n=1 Tax=Marinisporobacter balticus TaxID=2018667 RepID=A0A4R2KRV5_9FIRM|nr:H-type small acid-soluble spore protein [Marinisporobacter balticus]TCO76493.1 small acid-soluble spore protein H (minor) [Marinisporobacter balticus]